MTLILGGATACRVRLTSVNLLGVTFKIRVDDKRNWQLLLRSFEPDLFILVLLRKLGGLTLLFEAEFLVVLQKILASKGMEAVETVKLFVVILRPIVHQSTEVSYEAVMSPFALADDAFRH